MDNSVMYKLSYGLFVLTAKDGEKDNGCIINTAMQVTAEPNQIIIVVNKSNLTHDMVAKTGVFNVCVLSEHSKFALYQHFGFVSGREADKTIGIVYKRSENGLMYLTDGVNAYISGKVISQTDLGSHTMFLAEVTDGEILNQTESATYSYYQKNIKPQPHATKDNDNNDKKNKYVCEVCGYVYEGEELPEDFVCPICKHPACDFRKL